MWSGSLAWSTTTRSTWTTMSPRGRPCSRSARNCGNEFWRRPANPYNGPMPHPVIFDRPLLRARRARAAALGAATFLIERAADDLAGRLSAVLRKFDRAVDLGTPSRAVRRALADRVGAIVA